jgi:two-component system, cell cycle sensor histidine kinase and response regulator CckA
VVADRGQIEQVIVNLAVNARDAMPTGGTLTIEVHERRLDAEAVAQRPGLDAGRHVCLIVSDTGTGIDPETAAHLFEPFFTTKEPGRGTGLGLATVYGIAKQSEGDVHVESEVGEGTAVEVWLPRTPDAAVPFAAPRARAAAGGTERLLVVEDDPRVRDVTVRSLRGGGYDVLVAGSGAEALALDPRDVGDVRLLVTDVVMPGLDGRALATELVRRHPDLRVLYVSGYAQEAIAARGVLETGVELLPKPFTATALLAKVRSVLDGGATRSP